MLKTWFGTLFMGETENTLIQLLRYLFVGGAAFVVDFLTLFCLTNFLHLHYLLSAAAGFVLGLAANYFLSVRWVFSQRNIENRTAEFVLFAWIGVIGLGMNEAIMWVCVEFIAIHYLLAKVIATIMVFLWNFMARKYVLFNRRTVAAEAD